jgi:CRISPR/Cas system CSM-associated protein Csm2 small subunit
MRTCLSAQKLKTNDDFIRLAEFVEAILAYHKYRYG